MDDDRGACCGGVSETGVQAVEINEAGIETANDETRMVQMYLAHKTEVMLHMREAARCYFRSPYRHWNTGTLQFGSAETFADYVRRYVEDATRPRNDPGHDAEATLSMRLVGMALSRVDWDAIAACWRDAVKAECEIHCASL
jgi:hypothetical protein